MKQLVASATVGFVTLFAFSHKTSACSVCRCGDNAFQFSDQALPLANEMVDRKFRLSFSNSLSNKSNALDEDVGPGTESQREIRPSIEAMYELTPHFSFSAEFPVQFRRLTVQTKDGSEIEKRSGVGDADLSALWMTNFAARNGHHFSGGISLGVKVPTGRNKSEHDGERIEEHLQNGTGSVDLTIGGALARATCASRVFVSIYQRTNGTNDFEYHYGDATLLNLGAQRSITPHLIGSIQFNGRHAKRDFDHDEIVENTGGSVAYFTPGFRFALGPVASMSLSVQIPVWEDLYGVQDEKAVLLTGLNFDL